MSSSDRATSGEPSRKRQRFGPKLPRSKKLRLDTVAPQPALELLPDNICLVIMSLLDAASVIRLSRVCRRFNHLYRDEFVWNSVDLTTVARHLDVRKMKKIIADLLPPSMVAVRLASPRKKNIVTVPVMDDLFTKCSHIQSISIEDSDITLLSEHPSCKLFTASTLECVCFTRCVVPYKWMERVKPSWPNLTHISLNHCVKTSDHDLEFLAMSKVWTVSLRSLKVQGCYRITNNGIKTVAEKLKHLNTLDISHCAGLTEQCLEYLVLVHSMRSLSIVGIELSRKVCLELPSLFSHLDSLCLSKSPHLDSLIMPNTEVTVIQE